MPTSVIEQIRRMACGGEELRDGELLGRFIERHDEDALAALVNRHGPMVWGVCRRLLGHHDAEDAFQATFIVLVKKASSIAQRELVGNWLYGVAHQTALQARRAASRRKEVQVTEMPDVEAPQDQWDEMRLVLDEELSRLPAHYRAIIVLSDLEGKSRKEVAVQLGCPEGTVASRMVRARGILAKRLTQRGIALSGGALATVLSQQAASAGVPRSVVLSTIKAASLLAAGQAAISVKVAALTEGVLKTMLLSKLKAAVAVALVMGLMAIGATVPTSRTASAQGDKNPAAEKPVEPAAKSRNEKEVPAVKKAESVEPFDIRDMGKSDLLEEAKKAFTAWGKEVDGLQMGLATDMHTVRQGETAKFAVKLRNVGKADIKISHGLFRESPPDVTTSGGGKVSVFMPPLLGIYVVPTERIIKPGEIITLYNPEVAVQPEALMRLDGLMRVGTPTVCVDPGKYKIAYGGMIQSHPKLTTGSMEFEVKEPAKSVVAIKDDVAWGKEAGGLQAGIVGPGSVRIGEKARFVVKLRNASKKPIKVSAWPLWTCYPGVVDLRGNRVRTTAAPAVDFEILPKALTLKPGETVDIDKTDLLVAEPEQKVTVPDGVVDFCAIHVKPGMHKASCVGFLKENHSLVTGTVEFEVKPAIAADKQQDSPSQYTTADIVVQYRDETGREVRDLKQFRVDDARTVARLASHFPGILGERGSGPRTSAGMRATLTIKFNHRSGKASQLRVAHVTADYATWWWRDNTPYTGDRRVEGKNQLQSLIEKLAAKNKVDLK
jgi:RNA polymerase sigma factor (sigma-70 family)